MEKTINEEIRLFFMLHKRKMDMLMNEIDCKLFDRKCTGLQGQIIMYLQNAVDTDIYQKDIETKFNMKRSTATEILKLMENNGFIERHVDDKDARLKKIILTEKALDYVNYVKKSFNTLECLAKKDIPANELELFFTVMDKIKNNLQ